MYTSDRFIMLFFQVGLKKSTYAFTHKSKLQLECFFSYLKKQLILFASHLIYVTLFPSHPTITIGMFFMDAVSKKKKPQNRTFEKRVSFWVGYKHEKIIDSAGEILGLNRSELARKLFLFLDRPKEDIIKIFGSEVDEYEYPPKKAV